MFRWETWTRVLAPLYSSADRHVRKLVRIRKDDSDAGAGDQGSGSDRAVDLDDLGWRELERLRSSLR